MARQMKDSGVEWIGEIPEEWEVARLKTRFFFGKGLPITKENLVPAGVPVVSYGQVHSKSNNGTALSNELFRFVDESYLATNPQSLVHRGDFIVADTSEDVEGCGNCVYVDSDLVLFAGYHTIILFDKEARDNKYFAYLFQSNEWRNQIRCKASGVKVFSISRKILSDAYCTVPSTEEQTAISTYLDLKCAGIDKVVEQTRATIEEYKKLKQAIITEAVTKGVRGPRLMKPSGVEWIGDIPEEWKISRIKDLGKCSNGISKSGEYFGSGSPFVTYKDVYDNFSIISPTGLIESNTEEQSTYSVEKDDVFFTRTSETIEEIGFSSVCCQTIPNATFAGFIIRFRPQKGLLYCGYTKYYFRSNIHRSYFNKEMNIVTRASLSQTLLKKLSVLLPQYKEQQEIAAYLDTKCAEIDRIIEKKEQLIEKLGSYKKSLIYECVTGKREIKIHNYSQNTIC